MKLLLAELLEQLRWQHATASEAAGWAWIEARDHYLRLLAEHEEFMKQITPEPVHVQPGHFSTVKDYV